MRLSISSDNCMLGFLDAKTIDSLLDNVVVVRGHSEASQNTLDYSRGGILS